MAISSSGGVIIHLEPDILECEVKWALGSITMNKASGGDGIPAELLQMLKDDNVKGNPIDVAHQTPLPMEFSRQEYGAGCHALL